MNIKIWSDIQKIVSSKLPFSELKNKTITIFGATGQIGTAFVQTLNELNKQYDLNMTCCFVGRSVPKMLRLKEIFKNAWIINNNELSEISIPSNYIVYLACPTKSSDFVDRPYSTLSDILTLNKKVADHAFLTRGRIVYVSSVEVYGFCDTEDVTEDTRGILDFNSFRSSYPEGKRLSELYFLSLAKEKGLDVRILRPTLTFGGAILPHDNRVYAQFIRSILNNKDIVLHTEGKSKRDYLYVFDMIRALLIVLLLGKSGEAYNISNPKSYCSIREMAELAASLSRDSKVVYQPQENCGYAPEVHIRLNNDKINKLYYFKRTSLAEMFKTAILLTQEAEDAK